MTATVASPTNVDSLLAKAKDRTAVFGVVGLGYVGLPLAMEIVRAGYRVIGFDVNARVVDLLNGGHSHIQDVSASTVSDAVNGKKFSATADLARLKEPDGISIMGHAGDSAFDPLIDQARSQGILVTDDEVREFARYAPPNWIVNEPSLQTEGRFDPAKYQRLLASPQARQSGLLVQLEGYYRSEIPREKLFDQIASGVYVTGPELWRAWRDQHDSAQISYVAFTAAPVALRAASATAAEPAAVAVLPPPSVMVTLRA